MLTMLLIAGSTSPVLTSFLESCLCGGDRKSFICLLCVMSIACLPCLELTVLPPLETCHFQRLVFVETFIM